MTTFLDTNFEDGFAQFTDLVGNPTIVESPIAPGTKAMRASATDGQSFASKTIPPQRTLYLVGSTYVLSMTDGFRGWLAFYTPWGALIASIGCTYDRYLALRYWNGTDFYETVSASQISLNTPIKLKLFFFQDDVNGEVRVWLNNVEVSDLHMTNLDNIRYQLVTELLVGFFWSYGEGTVIIDDVKASDTDPDIPLQQVRLTHQSSPISVSATINGSLVPSGGYIDVPINSSVEITAPQEVEVEV